jgi:hypothetical protein
MELEKAAFMGRITAGVTHEIKNVLAIIKESAGLMEDLFELSKDHAPPPREKFLRTLTRITEQVRRGVDLATNLNEFAHTSDESGRGGPQPGRRADGTSVPEVGPTERHYAGRRVLPKDSANVHRSFGVPDAALSRGGTHHGPR